MTMMVLRDEIDFSAYMKETVGNRKIRSASDYIDEMIANIGKPEAIPFGWSLPWEKCGRMFQFHPGEVTLWAGANGTGKSLITGQLAVDMVCRRETVVIASLEMLPKKTLHRMMQQWSGMNPLSVNHIPEAQKILASLYEDFRTQADGSLYLYDQIGSLNADEALALVRYAAHELKAKHFILDSLMKCVEGEDNYNGQKNFVNSLCQIAKDTDMTIHLVAHTKKLGDEGKRPNKYDVSGSGSVTNLVDNVLLFWRNKPKEAERRAGGVKLQQEPDAVLMCCKQRELGEEPEFALWYDHDSQSYVESPGAKPIDFASRCV